MQSSCVSSRSEYVLPVFLGCATEVFHTEDGTCTGVFHRDARMRQTYAAFPEVLLCDATYKLTVLRMLLYLMLGIDDNGHSQVVAKDMAERSVFSAAFPDQLLSSCVCSTHSAGFPEKLH